MRRLHDPLGKTLKWRRLSFSIPLTPYFRPLFEASQPSHQPKLGLEDTSSIPWARFPDEIKLQILMQLFRWTNVMIKPACQPVEDLGRRPRNPRSHLTYTAISRASKEPEALCKPLYFVHTAFIYRQCYCKICADVGKHKTNWWSLWEWCFMPDIQYLVWHRSLLHYDNTTTCYSKHFDIISGIERSYLVNHRAPTSYQLKSLRLFKDNWDWVAPCNYQALQFDYVLWYSTIGCDRY